MFDWSLKSQNSSITKFYAGLLTAWSPESDNNLARKANNITIAGDSIPPYNWLIELKTVGSAAIRRKHPVFPCCWLQLITVRWKKTLQWWMSFLELASCVGGRVGDKQEASWIVGIFFFRLGIRWSHIVKDWKKILKHHASVQFSFFWLKRPPWNFWSPLVLSAECNLWSCANNTMCVG